MGYQFALEEIRHPEQVVREGQLPITLQGMAPFCYAWSVEFVLFDAHGTVVEHWPVSVDIRAWKPGPCKINASPSVKAALGQYRLALGILDPTTRKPAIQFAKSLPRLGGRP
jgi:hypothetical protein